jgi:hypothetical protein
MHDPDRIPAGPFVAALAGGAVIALIGIWLATAPFALGYQPEGADWTDATTVGMATGAGLIVLGVLVVGLLTATMHGEATRRGIAPSRPERDHTDRHEQHDDHRPHPGSDEVAALLAPLAAALLEDLRNGPTGAPNGQPPAPPSADGAASTAPPTHAPNP